MSSRINSRLQKRLAKIEAKINSLGTQALRNKNGVLANAYVGDPVGYAENVLEVRLTPDQENILKCLLTPPYKVLVPSANNTGKSFIAAVATNFWADSYDPGVVLTTAPTRRDVQDLLWGEIRLQRSRAGLPAPFIGPRAPEMFWSDQHYCKGFTARHGEMFRGRHKERMLFIFDESSLIDQSYYTNVSTMFDVSQHHAWLCIYNPTSTDSPVYREDHAVDEGRADWHRIRLSALNHPNIRAELLGQPKPIPGAVSLAMIDDMVRGWCDLVPLDLKKADDIEWPPSSITGKPGLWYRPGGEFMCHVLGQWPTTGENVWSELLFNVCCQPSTLPLPVEAIPRLGCDTSQGRSGDWTSIHGQFGHLSLLHTSSNTMDPIRIAGALRQACEQLCEQVNRLLGPKGRHFSQKQIPIQIDDDATGNAIIAILRREGFHIRGIGAGTKASRPDRYPNKRSELWFQGAAKARAGNVCFAALDHATLQRLRQQLLAPAWDMDISGRRHVEPKDATKSKIGRSPDDADSFHLAVYDANVVEKLPVVDVPPREDQYQTAKEHPTQQGRDHEDKSKKWGLGTRR